jgi:hypothetical protein
MAVKRRRMLCGDDVSGHNRRYQFSMDIQTLIHVLHVARLGIDQ